MSDDLTYWANISSIGAFAVTFIGSVVGIYGYANYMYKWSRKKEKLEVYLEEQKKLAPPGRLGQKTAKHLVRHLGLTEDEILKISFESKRVRRRVGVDDQGNADVLYFEYAD